MSGDLSSSQLAWAVSDCDGVHIATILRNKTSIWTFSREGVLQKKTDFDRAMVDAAVNEQGQLLVATPSHVEYLKL